MKVFWRQLKSQPELKELRFQKRELQKDELIISEPLFLSKHLPILDWQ